VKPNSFRLSAFGGVCVLVGIVGAVLIALTITKEFTSDSTPLVSALIAIVSSAIPGVLSLYKTEQVQNDIRNGVVTEKAREGAKQALIDHNVVTRDGPTVAATLESLQVLLQSNQNLLEEISKDHKEGNGNGRPSV
jgi:hypothetical protein